MGAQQFTGNPLDILRTETQLDIRRTVVASEQQGTVQVCTQVIEVLSVAGSISVEFQITNGSAEGA